MRSRLIRTKWRAFICESPLRKLGQDALIAASFSLFARGLGFIKEVLVAASFGLSGALDVYLVAFVLIGFPLSIVINSVQTALISVLAIGNISVSDGNKLYSLTTVITLGFLAILLPLWLMLLPFALPWLASGFAPEKQQGLKIALFWLVPYYFLNGLNLLSYGVLQARGSYLLNGILPSATPIVTILILILTGATGDWRPLVVSIVVGMLIESILILFSMYRSNQLVLPSLSDAPKIKHIVSASLALMPGTFMLALGPVIEQAIAASMAEGTNAALGYGFKLPTALQGILLTAIGITVLPYFSSQLGQNRTDYCLHSLNKLTRWLLIGGGVLVVPLSFFSEEIIALLYQRAAFDTESTSRVAPIQMAYFVQLPFALIAMLGMKTLVALGRNGRASIYTIITVLMQSILAYVLGMRYGAVGIAWAATLGSVLLASASYLTARSTLHRLSQ